MKKEYKLFIVLILLTSIFISSCTPQKSQKPKIQNPSQSKNEVKGAIDETEVEADINHVSIKEDNKITATTKTNGNIDYLLTDKNFLQNNKTLTNLSIGTAKLNRTFQTVVPTTLNVDLMYNRYLMPYDYCLITKENVNVYLNPSFSSNVVGNAKMFDKVKLINEVVGEKNNDTKSNKWFGISWYDNEGNLLEGFIPNGYGEIRTFKFDNMYAAIKELEIELKNYKYGYISNYKDLNGSPPLLNGKGLDKYGMQAYQSAPAYSNLNNLKEFRYLPDGMLTFILGEDGDYFKVKVLGYNGEYWIPKKYISFDNNIDRMTKAIVVDTTNQNEGVFEKRGTKWTLVSYTLATTGVRDKLKYETPVGRYKVMDKKDRFYYLDDKTREVTGYAPYGLRFTQGAYVHGIPVEFIIKDGKKVDPGIKEYLLTIGTVPRSHKCVRNYTSHAKFLFSWADPNDTAVLIIK